MGLLQDLFPGIQEFANDLPEWEDVNNPWHILRDDAKGIQSQISGLGDSEDGIIIHPSAIVGDFVNIEGPSYVGPMAQIRHGAFLRKGSWICERAVVGHSTEVKNSILLPGAKAPHFNYVGDSIIGFDANLGAGVKLSNVRNDGREVIIQLKSGERVNSGMKKMGALVGDRSQIGCNAVSNPGTIIQSGSLINPNETISGWISNSMS